MNNRTIGNKYTKILSAVLVLGCMIFIFVMSHQSASTSSSESSRISDFLRAIFTFLDKPWLHNFIRKCAHGFEYCLLGITGCIFAYHYPIKTSRRILYTLIGCTVYAVTDEIHQSFIPGRACMASDVLIDAAGALVGILFIVLILRRRK